MVYKAAGLCPYAVFNLVFFAEIEENPSAPPYNYSVSFAVL